MHTLFALFIISAALVNFVHGADKNSSTPSKESKDGILDADEEFVVISKSPMKSPLLPNDLLEQMDLPEATGIYSKEALDPFLHHSSKLTSDQVTPNMFYFRPIPEYYRNARHLHVIFAHSFQVRWGVAIFWQLVLVTGHIVTLFRGSEEEWKPLMVIRPHQPQNIAKSCTEFNFDASVPPSIYNLGANSILLERAIIEANRLVIHDNINFPEYPECFAFLGFPTTSTVAEADLRYYADSAYYAIDRSLIQKRFVPMFNAQTGGNLLRRSVGLLVNMGTITAGKDVSDFLGLLDNTKAKNFLRALDPPAYSTTFQPTPAKLLHLHNQLCALMQQAEESGLEVIGDGTTTTQKLSPDYTVNEILSKEMDEYRTILTGATTKATFKTNRSNSSSSSKSGKSEVTVNIGAPLAEILLDRCLLHACAILYDQKLSWLSESKTFKEEELNFGADSRSLAAELYSIRPEHLVLDSRAYSPSSSSLTTTCTNGRLKNANQSPYVWKRRDLPAWGVFRYLSNLCFEGDYEQEKDYLGSL